MTAISSRKSLRASEIGKRKRRARVQKGRAIASIEKSEIIVSDDAPKSREELLAKLKEPGQKGYSPRNVFAYIRHNHTNYDRQIKSLYHRFGVVGNEAKVALRTKTFVATMRYLRSIGADDLIGKKSWKE